MHYIVTVALLIFLSLDISAKTIHKEKSIYRNIVITEKNSRRCMQFETRRRSASNQACIDLKNKDSLVFEYTRSIMVGLALNPSPKRILVIGLGGGSLAKIFAKIVPQSEVVSVEIDPAVVKLAKRYFDYTETEKITTQIKDGRVYVKRALIKKERFDWIILDAFNGDYIPEHLLTTEFLTEVKTLLSPGGIVSANTFTGSKLYDYESVTYQSVFEHLKILKSPTKGNRIIFACNCDFSKANIRIEQPLIDTLAKYSIDIEMLSNRLSNRVDWKTNLKPLSDQFSPSNLLNQ